MRQLHLKAPKKYFTLDVEGNDETMAGNFWQSSHCAQWVLNRADLLRERNADLQVLSEDEYQKVIIFFANFIQVIFSLNNFRLNQAM